MRHTISLGTLDIAKWTTLAGSNNLSCRSIQRYKTQLYGTFSRRAIVNISLRSVLMYSKKLFYEPPIKNTMATSNA